MKDKCSCAETDVPLRSLLSAEHLRPIFHQNITSSPCAASPICSSPLTCAPGYQYHTDKQNECQGQEIINCGRAACSGHCCLESRALEQ